jgi:hypothetical protein
LQVIFAAFALACGLKFSVNAFTHFRKGDSDAVALSIYAGAIAILLGVLFGLSFVEAF